ncbi:MAG: 4Fe-4S dicluster domain-containing protein [Bacteroidales bacterium]|nr:4Fe-4S dicluster domain-containing protein [Bacteroidales bacterium]
MIKQIIFLASLLLTFGIFTYTVLKYIGYFKLLKPAFPIKNIGKRTILMLKVAFVQTKIFRSPVIGLIHALVFWGFCVILIGSIEMIIDGIASTERVLKVLGIIYNIIIAVGDISAFIIAIAIIVFLFRRLFLNVKRYNGIEMKHKYHIDANIALTLIFLLMITLLGMNSFYLQHVISSKHEVYGAFPVSRFIAPLFSSMDTESLYFWHEFNWWGHILTIFFFANYLPYSKHFHVFMSVPNVFLSRLELLGKLANMENITKEVKLMLDPNAPMPEASEDEAVERFGVLDIEDVTWKNYFDSLACTQCGRCTSVCPANITGKKLSPRKVIMNIRERMKEKGPGLVKNGKEYSDNKSILRDFISEEELWACTTCNSCAQECPININHPSIIVDMRRYIVMEEAAAPGELNTIFTNIENNGAPWQFSPEDRMLWAEDIYMNIKSKI